MATNFEKLQRLLEELFQLDQADLDFGIYRIMNQKRDEVVSFLEKDLLPQVKEAFGHYKSADKSVLQTELDKLIEQVAAAGMNPEDSPKVQEIRQQMADSSVDVTALENEVFSHLYNFFRRYYHDGDFISLRRYKEGTYAIPYEGEEVKLHWANHDQYYIKSSEYFRDYIFTMPSGKRVRVHLVAASSEQDNKKEVAGKERRFIISEKDPVYEENGELYIRFEYRSDDGKKRQDKLNQEAIERVLETDGFDGWINELSKLAPTKANPKRTVLEKHLTQYTARNTFDYFIHKDLGGFLRRELDFYIKNEVMHLDDIEHESAPRVEQYLSQIRVIRMIAHKIIQFLEQLENFQKKLWLKKKFVVETNYCITLDRVPEELYPEITANDAQREEWVRLFAIDEVKGDMYDAGYSEPLTVEFLKSQPSLVLDTAYFSDAFVTALLSNITDMEEALDGVIIDSDNYQAMSLLHSRFANQLACVYIDPPYNTGNDGFVYKDNYQHSSWVAMMQDRLAVAHSLLRSDGSIFVSIDDNESHRLRHILDNAFGPSSFVAQVEWQKRYTRSNNTNNFTTVVEHILVYAKSESFQVRLLPRTDEANARFTNPDNDPRGPWKAVPFLNPLSPQQRPNLCYELTNPNTGQTTLPTKKAWRRDKSEFERLMKEDRFWWGKNGQSAVPDVKVFLSEVKQGMTPITFWDHEFAGHTDNANAEIKALFSDKVFDTPKPSTLIRRVWQHGTDSDTTDYVMDFFAGSGTAAHAVIEQNREDSGNRKYILVENALYFDLVLKERIQKIIYSSNWSDGKPEERRGSGHAFKYLRLESYEDALNNLEIERTQSQQSLLDQDDDLRGEYVLSYMLDVESRGSQSLLNVDSFRNPNEYKLRVERNGETQLVNVDLVETFNWFLGLIVKHIDVIRGVRVVEGTTSGGDRILVLWRNLNETDNNTLDEWFQKQDYNTKDQEYDVIYVNGDNNIENLRRADQTWKVRLIEEEMARLMFASQTGEL